MNMSEHKLSILLLGAGNVAWHIGPALQSAGYRVVQVYSRTAGSARDLGEKMGIPWTDRVGSISNKAEMALLALADSAITSFTDKLPAGCTHLVHLSGSLESTVLRGKAEHYGVLYPLMTFSRERPLDFQHVPFCVEAGDPIMQEILEEMATRLSGNVSMIPYEQRRKLHLAATIACNFSNHMYHMAEAYLADEGLDFEMLKPLIFETASKLIDMAPAQAQTGPARRGDTVTLEAHYRLLEGRPELQKIYTFVSDSIRRMNIGME